MLTEHTRPTTVTDTDLPSMPLFACRFHPQFFPSISFGFERGPILPPMPLSPRLQRRPPRGWQRQRFLRSALSSVPRPPTKFSSKSLIMKSTTTPPPRAVADRDLLACNHVQIFLGDLLEHRGRRLLGAFVDLPAKEGTLWMSTSVSASSTPAASASCKGTFLPCKSGLPAVPLGALLGHHGQIQHDKMLVFDGAVVVVDLAGDLGHKIVELHQSSGKVSTSPHPRFLG